MKLRLSTIGFEIDEDDLESYGYYYYNIYRMIFNCYDKNKQYRRIEFDYLTASEFLEYFDINKGEFPYKNNADGNVHWLTTFLKFNITENNIEFYAHSKPDKDKDYEEMIEEEFNLNIPLKVFTDKLNEFKNIINYLKNGK